MKQIRRIESSYEPRPPSWFGVLVERVGAALPDIPRPAVRPWSRRRERARAHRHSAWTIALHWASVIAIVLAAGAALSRELTEAPLLRDLLMTVHRQAGMFVLLALGLRLAARFTFGMKDHAGNLPVLMKLAATMAHLALYAMLLSLPVLGWAVSNAHGVDLKLFGVLPLPSLVQEDSDLADRLTDYHVWASWGLLFLVVAHVAAACWHHLARRDGVLSAMLPLIKQRSPRVYSVPVEAQDEELRETERKRA